MKLRPSAERHVSVKTMTYLFFARPDRIPNRGWLDPFLWTVRENRADGIRREFGNIFRDSINNRDFRWC
jgi:hypothetical protein